MNFALLWIDALFIALLWVAASSALIGRLKRRWVRVLLVLIVNGVPLFLLGGFAFAATVIKVTTTFKPDWFGYSVSLLAAYLIFASVILRKGRRQRSELLPSAATWPAWPLAFAWVMAVAVGYMTLLNMDLVIRARSAIESAEVNTRYLAALPAVASDSQNAAPLYEKAFARLRDDPPTDVKNPPTGNNENFDPNEPATIAYLAREAGTIEILHHAGALSGCRFDADLSVSNITPMLDGLNQDRLAANVLYLHAKESLAHGDVSAAMVDADTVLHMSRHIGQRPMLISGLVGMGLGHIGDRILNEALPVVTNRAQMPGRYLQDLQPVGRMFQQALRGEERFGLACYDNLSMKFIDDQTIDPGLMPTSAAGPVGAIYRVFILDTDAYVRMMELLQDLSTQPCYKSKDQLTDMYIKRGDSLAVSIILPSFNRSFETCGTLVAEDACAEIAVAMTRFRLDHGTLPTRLSELVPAYLEEVPVDPFDGHPIRLTIKKDQSIIYSVGPDEADDGGVETNREGKGDIVFALTSTVPNATGKPAGAPGPK